MFTRSASFSFDLKTASNEAMMPSACFLLCSSRTSAYNSAMSASAVFSCFVGGFSLNGDLPLKGCSAPGAQSRQVGNHRPRNAAFQSAKSRSDFGNHAAENRPVVDQRLHLFRRQLRNHCVVDEHAF